MTTITPRPTPVPPSVPPRALFTETVEDVGVLEAEITVTATFKAYVLADHPERTDPLDAHIGEEVADALIYRATHLTDTEPGDALIAISSGPVVRAQVVSTCELTPARVADAVALAHADASQL